MGRVHSHIHNFYIFYFLDFVILFLFSSDLFSVATALFLFMFFFSCFLIMFCFSYTFLHALAPFTHHMCGSVLKMRPVKAFMFCISLLMKHPVAPACCLLTASSLFRGFGLELPSCFLWSTHPYSSWGSAHLTAIWFISIYRTKH